MDKFPHVSLLNHSFSSGFMVLLSHQVARPTNAVKASESPGICRGHAQKSVDFLKHRNHYIVFWVWINTY